MADSNSSQESKISKSLVTEDGVRNALKAKFGEDAELNSWEIVDFTKKGDNYMCDVSSVVVNYTKSLEKRTSSFVVKLSHNEGLLAVNDTSADIFMKEGGFYTNIVPELDKILISSGQPELKVPKCYNLNLRKGNEIIFFEDLRNNGFKMTDRKKGLDEQHLNLFLKELGRFHAASILLQDSKSKKELIEQYPCLEELFFNEKLIDDASTIQFTSSLTENASKILEQIEGYEQIAEEIKQIDYLGEVISELKSTRPFEVISHGDCWTNNVLFK